MKKYPNTLQFLCLLSVFIFSCDGDKTVDMVYNEMTRGAILRTIDIESDETPYNYDTSQFENSSFTIVLEEMDYEDGTLLQEVRAYIRFQDNTDLESTLDEGISTDEVLFTTIPASEFATGDDGLPRYTFSITVDEMIATTGIDITEVKGGDNWIASFELELTDGRIFNKSTVGATVSGGAYFASPFTYTINIPCVITESLAGSHSFETTGTFIGTVSDFPGECTETTISGTVNWGDSDTPGSYSTSDLSFGLYPCYGTNPDTESGASINWVCEGLEIVRGEVEEGDDEKPAYSYMITNVSGPEMTIEWSNSLGEGGTTIVTRENGEDWPDIFLENN
ncbi:hypothetical protein [Sinomicrobium sp. M5D2P17]